MLLRRWSVFDSLWTAGEVSLRFFKLILCMPMLDVGLVGAVLLHFVEYRLPLILHIVHGHFSRSPPCPKLCPKAPETALDSTRPMQTEWGKAGAGAATRVAAASADTLKAMLETVEVDLQLSAGMLSRACSPDR